MYEHKFVERDDDLSFIYRILSPPKYHVVTCLIQKCLLKNCQAKLQTVENNLREKY